MHGKETIGLGLLSDVSNGDIVGDLEFSSNVISVPRNYPRANISENQSSVNRSKVVFSSYTYVTKYNKLLQ